MDRWKFAAVAGWSLVGVVLLAGAGERGELKLKQLVIQDERGRDAIRLETVQGNPSVTLMKPGTDEIALRLAVTEDYPSVSLYNHSTHKPGLLMQPGVAVMYSEKRLKEARVIFMIGDDDKPVFRLDAPGKRTVVKLPNF